MRRYSLLFDALYPAHFDLFVGVADVCAAAAQLARLTLLVLLGMQAWCDAPAVIIPLLKFIAELVYNRSQVTDYVCARICHRVMWVLQRVVFDNCSPNGILLFREMSKLLVAFGRRIQYVSPRVHGCALALH